jgi:nicotinamide-nucleotide adenylyltransferase
MSEKTASPAALQRLRLRYRASLQRFAASSESFQILDTVADEHTEAGTLETLYILDSSFNPPTLAHLRIASSALGQDATPSCTRLLLLLATQNADKPSKPASFEDRLVMMNLLAQDLRSRVLESPGHSSGPDVPPADIGVTKLPYFIDKAAAIAEADVYPESVEQVHLTGFDTLVRIFDTNYYPPEHTLRPLESFLSRHRLKVTLRPDDGWGGREDQQSFLAGLAQGTREFEGGKREWAERIELVDGRKDGEEAVSSTKARQAVVRDVAALDKLVTPSIRDWMISENLYAEG